MTWWNVSQSKTGDTKSQVHMGKSSKVVADLDLSGRGQGHPPSLVLDETEVERVPTPLLTTLKCIIFLYFIYYLF